MKNIETFLFLTVMAALVVACSQAKKESQTETVAEAETSQPSLGYRSAKVLEVDGLQFKDLNRNGQLDPYENWRLTPAERSRDLLGKMSLEEKVGMLLIADIAMYNEAFMLEASGQTKPITSAFNEQDIVIDKNQFTGEPLPFPVMNRVGTTKGILQHKMRHFIWRTTTAPADTMARWANKVQALAESDSLGIPVLFASNPRNHITTGALGATGSTTVGFSKWPSEIGLGAMADSAMVHRFGDMARQEWLAVGIRKGYMYMADLATEPRWQRIEGTFGEDPAHVAQSIAAITLGFQGSRLGRNSVAMTTKHYPGGGSAYKGFDPHYRYGRFAVFPGGQMEENMRPFQAAIRAGTSSIMPYYSLPKDTKYEEVAYAYNKALLRDVLRGQMGFKGIINSDTGPIESMPWGVENLNIEQRYIKALEAGTNMFAGNADPFQLLKTLKAHPEAMKYVDESVTLLLVELFQLGLFENPYVDEAKAGEVVGKQEFVEAGKEAQRKSVVLLRNEKIALPLAKNSKVYFEEYAKNYSKMTSGPGKVYSKQYEGLTFVSNPQEADVILLWVKPTIRPLFPSDDSPLRVNLSNCAVDVNYINTLTARKPTVLVINYANPFVIDEVYNDQTRNRFTGVMATFGVEPEALLDVVTGKTNPTGKMPFTTPVSQQAVENNKEDLPGYKEGDGYALFKFGEGLGYKQVQ
ncbi:glycoside hydrolase family 3 N-terminal domain-containing protein [Rufibacter glacialis]|uniref:beta-glucosidase n=1 Tax=Rufibacter glacialis TaxID=1259555 RepID=A0A5M8QSY8_9BACT|nr:glycoside hydrolase family 3 N-terminal domain-containing protein [Rufibacter glacialis]KAA6438160.1 glycoside hydrolase family 3 protein [Rufibacter glacialis]GGK89094.1 beta-glucosidase [Rufibacter glacialis]